jgi:hypothetical protein
MSLPNKINLGTIQSINTDPASSLSKLINLNLINPFTTSSGKTYYFLDRNGDGGGSGGLYDKIDLRDLGLVLNASSDSSIIKDSQVNGAAYGVDDGRSAVYGEYTIVLPTKSELLTLWQDMGGTAASNPMIQYSNHVWSATPDGNGRHWLLQPWEGAQNPFGNDGWQYHVFLQVIGRSGATAVTASYSINSKFAQVNEGSSALFEVVTSNVLAGTLIDYNIVGLANADIVGGRLTGQVEIGTDGKGTISVPIAADLLSEGTENLTVNLQGQSASATINDTSKTILAPLYNLVSESSSVSEGDTATFTLYTTNVQAGTSLSYSISGVSASDILGGTLNGNVMVDTNGRATISIPVAADLMTEGPEVLTVNVQNSTANITINDTSKATLPPTYNLSGTSSSVNEGDNATFTLYTTNVQAGTSVPYVISGLSATDITDGAVNGSVSVNAAGLATISIPISADKVTEGTETLTVTAGSKSASVQILDTSKQSVVTNYSIAPSASSVNEGSTAKFTVTATGVTAGASGAYTLSGLNAEDITGGEVNGRVTFDDLGMATISVPIAADNKTEGSESLTLTMGSASSSVTINDTSKATSQFYITASDGLIEEGRVATFTVSAADAVPGTKIAYTISGTGITAKDIVNGKLSGSVAVGVDSTAIITVPLKADKTTEGDEDLTVTLTSLGVAETITIEDTSTDLPTVPTYALTAVESSVTEGADAEFLLETTGVETGTQLKYTIAGVSTSDVVGKKLSGTVEVSEDGTASIVISTASDALAEGNETLTLTINGQKASVAVLDDTSIKVAQTMLEGSYVSLYKASSGVYVLAPAGLADGDALEEFKPLKASAMKDYTPKGALAILSYDDGSYGLISSTGTGSKISYSEQKFSEDGIAKGKLTKLTTAQVIAKETTAQLDINNDGFIGEVITTVFDSDGDANQQDYGLYKTSSGTIVLAASELAEEDSIGDSVILMASKIKGWTIPAGSSIEGIALTDGGSVEVLSLKGKQYSAQKFDPDTGLMKGKAIVLKTAQVDVREYYYDLDLTGDDEISIIGQETTPIGWAV